MTATTAETRTAVYSRRSVIHADATRSVLGSDLVAGDVLATGVILEVTRNDIDGEARLEMPGADIHYVDYDEPVSVLATVTREVLNAISLGTFIARATLRPTRTPHDEAPVEPAATISVVEPEVTLAPAPAPPGRTNPGPIGQYDEGVEHYTDLCSTHGETTFAIHKAGRNQAGEQRYNRRCLACHTDYNLIHRG